MRMKVGTEAWYIEIFMVSSLVNKPVLWQS
jgi:hypothetical protein